MADLERRRFLRYGLGLAGAGLFSLGLADFAYPKLLGGVGGTTNTSSATTSTGSASTSTKYSQLPDYQEFLSWLHSVSGPYSGKPLNMTLEAEFGPYAAQLISNDFQ